MTSLKQIRWTAIALLLIGFALAYSSGLVEHEAVASSENQFAHIAAVMAGKLFTIAAILILVWAIEWQRAKTAARLTALEEEMIVLRQQMHAMTQPPVRS
jgi:cell division protein FtsW (lipid II flippase)